MLTEGSTALDCPVVNAERLHAIARALTADDHGHYSARAVGSSGDPQVFSHLGGNRLACSSQFNLSDLISLNAKKLDPRVI